MSRKIIRKAPQDLRPHPLSKELYGAPTANGQYENIKFSMQKGGFDERHPLLITEGGSIISGVTRWAAARSLKLDAVPCEVFVPPDPATAELDIEDKLIAENRYRTRTRLMEAREQRKLVENEKIRARQRMAQGSDGGPSASQDRVGLACKVSGKTIQRNLKVLAAIDRAAAEGDARKAARLTELLEHGKTGKAIDLIDGKAAGGPKKPVKVSVPRTFNDHSNRVYSEGFEACCKAQVAAELDQLQANLNRVQQEIDKARARLAQRPE
jgi:hypothetical protein